MSHMRYYARKGDWTTAGGVISEGLASFCLGERPASFEGAAVWCPACKSTGRICASGPRRPFMLPNGRQIALDNDLCLCQCSPPPRLIASQSQAGMSVAGDAPAHAAQHTSGTNVPELAALFDEQFAICDDRGEPIPHALYSIQLESGAREHGQASASGHTSRLSAMRQVQSVHIYVALAT
jgi:uncharacterized Zn-binding protein involved in type VI secretion